MNPFNDASIKAALRADFGDHLSEEDIARARELPRKRRDIEVLADLRRLMAPARFRDSDGGLALPAHFRAF